MFLAVTVLPYSLCALQVDVDLINGDLETGDLTGWTGEDTGNFTNEKREVIATGGGDPADKGNYMYEGNDYFEFLSSATDLWQAETEYTIMYDAWYDPDADIQPFIAATFGTGVGSGSFTGLSPRFGWAGGFNPPAVRGWHEDITEYDTDGSSTVDADEVFTITTGDASQWYIGQPISLKLEIWSNSNDYYTRVDNVKILRTVESYENPRYLTMAAPGSATVVPAAGEHVYEYNTTVNISADVCYTDGDFYVFDHWDSVGKAPEEPSQRVTTIVMDANSILTAVYVQSTSFTLTVNGPPGVGTTPSVGANLYAQGTTVNISAPEFYSYNGDYRKFSHW